MEIIKNLEGEKLLVKLVGRLDSVTAPELEESLKGELENAKEVEFDFSDLEYISSAGLRILLATQRTMSKQEGEMSVCGCNDTILEIFEVTGFSDIFTIK